MSSKRSWEYPSERQREFEMKEVIRIELLATETSGCKRFVSQKLPCFFRREQSMISIRIHRPVRYLEN